jgi:SAM-dependent methyltransferase
MSMQTSQDDTDFHRRYFLGRGRTTRIALGATRCVRRHFSRTIDPLQLAPGARVLELGCGLGRFTEMLLERDFYVTALDLSPHLIERLQKTLVSARLAVAVGGAEHLATLVAGPFDAVVGFFFLHHLREPDEVLGAARSVLAPGGQIAFCEPNAFNPLIYAQVIVTPGMSFKGEPGITRMRPAVVFPILRRLGFEDVRTDLYGALPPVLANTAPGAVAERAIELVRPLRPLSAYRVFSARLPQKRPAAS